MSSAKLNNLSRLAPLSVVKRSSRYVPMWVPMYSILKLYVKKQNVLQNVRPWSFHITTVNLIFSFQQNLEAYNLKPFGSIKIFGTMFLRLVLCRPPIRLFKYKEGLHIVYGLQVPIPAYVQVQIQVNLAYMVFLDIGAAPNRSI